MEITNKELLLFTLKRVWVKITKMPTKIKNVANALNSY